MVTRCLRQSRGRAWKTPVTGKPIAVRRNCAAGNAFDGPVPFGRGRFFSRFWRGLERVLDGSCRGSHTRTPAMLAETAALMRTIAAASLPSHLRRRSQGKGGNTNITNRARPRGGHHLFGKIRAERSILVLASDPFTAFCTGRSGLAWVSDLSVLTAQSALWCSGARRSAPCSAKSDLFAVVTISLSLARPAIDGPRGCQQKPRQ